MRRAIVVMLLLFALPAHADERPWAVGVSDEQQAIALDIYKEGNQEFSFQRFQQALAKYRVALTHWDHPAIHFNIVVCLINLDQPLEAHEHLVKAMAFGVPGIGDEASYAEAVTFRKLLDAQLAKLHVACKEPGAEISLDGKVLMTGPGETNRVLLPGDHQIVATKPGYITQSESLVLVAGRLATHDIRLVAFEQAPRVVLVRRWEVYKPWLVVGLGAAAAGVGGIAFASASANIDAYEAGIAMRCPRGCSADMASLVADLRETRERADLQQAFAIGAWVLGGAALVTGAVGVWLNQPRTALVTPVAGGGATVGMSWSF